MPRDANRGRREGVYGTKEVAKVLDIPEWRVKNFSQGAAYGLPPSKTMGKGGRGSRRLYYFDDVLRIGIAHRLVLCGFTAEAVGHAMQEVTPSMQSSWEDWAGGSENPPVLMTCVDGKWAVRKRGDVTRLAAATLHRNRENLFILDFFSLWTSIHNAIERFENMPEGER